MADRRNADPPVPARRVVYMPLGQITPAPRNPKDHHGSAIRSSIERFGLADLPVLDERTGRLVSGHGRLEQAQAMYAAGQDPPDGLDIDPESGEWRLPVIRGWASRSDIEADAYLVTANHTTTLGGWDDAALGQLLAELNDSDPALFEVTGFTDEDLAALLDDGGQQGGGPGAGSDEGAGPEVPTVPTTAAGDLWTLGDHRLLCGDATNPDHLARVLEGLDRPGIVYTDPPYGISAVPRDGGASRGGPKWGLKGDGNVIAASTYLPVKGDETTQTAADAFRLLMAAHPAARHIWWGGNHYATSACLPDATCWLVWDKQNGGNDFADAELAWTNHSGPVRLFQHLWNGMARASEHGKRVHPTQKPVKLCEWSLGVVDPKNERRVVLDAFGGSGSTLIAAHLTGRTAAIIECEPAYVDVIIKRWVRQTGLDAVREDGVPWSDLCPPDEDEG